MKVKRRKVSKDEILKKGAEIFSKKGFFLSRVEDITQALSIAKGTFYLYFKNKDELLGEIIYKLHQEIYKTNSEIAKKKQNWDKKFKLLIRKTLEFIRKNIVFIRVFVQDGLRKGAGFKGKPSFEKIMKLYQENQKVLSDFFREGVKKDFLNSFFSPEELALFFDFFVRSRITKFIFVKKKVDIKLEEKIFYNFFLKGAGR